MKVNYNFPQGKTIGVAVSGGSDSMALLYYMQTNAKKLGISVVCINVEHGIRGKNSLSDSSFVKNYCKMHNIPFYPYSVDSLDLAKSKNISIEEAARELRYQCFLDAMETNKCDYVATAHHLLDNMESVLFNIFRGTGIKGLSGITEYNNIIRPFKSVSKVDITNYLKENDIPFVTDETNLDDNYTRNNIRHNIIPKILDIFKEADSSIYRLSLTAKEDNDYLEKQADSLLQQFQDKIVVKDGEKPIHSRAMIKALKLLGVEHDWQKIHLEDLFSLCEKENGKSLSLPQGIKAFREYGVITLAKCTVQNDFHFEFETGTFIIGDSTYTITEIENKDIDLKRGFYIAKEKIDKSAIIRPIKDGDIFKNCGGKTKKLNDFLTDKKIPLRIRKTLPVIEHDGNILAIMGVAVSDIAKAQPQTKYLYKITKDN